MKRASLNFLAVAGLSLGLFAFGSIKEGGIQGKVTPAEGAKEVVAIAGTDTLKSQISNGAFVFSNVKKGTYTVWIKANAPYKDASVENVAVVDSATTDIGEIKLQQ
ncbi:carboxypeptidase regulatory-like domain-containing protein [Pedobacter sp. LMG 31464]|uniref:Carboxypeptidase regulatory-like domain-containing protein n=1 Tax=Pedobacter planticolens TaxID=2679964 RepID=A0A923E2M6_9SPHI|nr:carboxypeptidase-like regulatory domain-containing protein [Pedobacter planticolens]MBB2146409.1 carboxypeptidase regulatory-like domain-containing protein [Pedobacter planticolens]